MEHPHQQQLNAMAAVVGVLIGILRAKEAITPDEQEALFAFAIQVLPDSSAGFGDQIMSVIRNSARLIGSSPADGDHS